MHAFAFTCWTWPGLVHDRQETQKFAFDEIAKEFTDDVDAIEGSLYVSSWVELTIGSESLGV